MFLAKTTSCSLVASLFIRLARNDNTWTLPGTYPLVESIRSRVAALLGILLQEERSQIRVTPSKGQILVSGMSVQSMVNKSLAGLLHRLVSHIRYLWFVSGSSPIRSKRLSLAIRFTRLVLSSSELRSPNTSALICSLRFSARLSSKDLIDQGWFLMIILFLIKNNVVVSSSRPCPNTRV